MMIATSNKPVIPIYLRPVNVKATITRIDDFALALELDMKVVDLAKSFFYARPMMASFPRLTASILLYYSAKTLNSEIFASELVNVASIGPRDFKVGLLRFSHMFGGN